MGDPAVPSLETSRALASRPSSSGSKAAFLLAGEGAPAEHVSIGLRAGPLIRILGDRFAWEIKAAILHTLGLLIGKAGTGLKPFVPQLQTTFLKCLADQV